MSSWTSGDCWYLRREHTDQVRTDYIDEQLYEKRVEIAEILHRRSPEWSRVWDRAHKALRDDKYMAFRTKMLGDLAPRKRGRPAKPKEVSHG